MKTKRDELIRRSERFSAWGGISMLLAIMLPSAVFVLFGRESAVVIFVMFCVLAIVSAVLLLHGLWIQDEIHELNLVLEHIHTHECNRNGEIQLVERKTRIITTDASSSWGGSMSMRVTDYERMQCSSCKSITFWKANCDPVLEQ